MIKDILNDILLASKESPANLYERLIKERLQLALKSYYSDLTSKFNTYLDEADKNLIRTVKKLNKYEDWMTFEENISKLSTIPVKSIEQLSRYINSIHSHDLVTQMMDDKSTNIFEIQLFEGTLMLQIIDDSIKYKFIPSEEFSKAILDTVLSKKSLLVNELDKKLQRILQKAYKDVL